jgi:hypothetical protein
MRWRAPDGLARLARERLVTMWRTFGGARIGVARTPLDAAALRLLVRADGRRALDVAASSRGSADVRILASLPARLDRESRYWVPSNALRDEIVAHGVPRARVQTIRFPPSGTPRTTSHLRDAVILVASGAEAASASTLALGRALGTVRWRALALDAPSFSLDAVRNADLVIVADDDRWGIVVTEALAHGALVVAPAGTPSLEIFPEAAYVVVPDGVPLAAAVAEVRARFDAFAPCAQRGAREVARRLPVEHAGARLRALAVEAAHGVPSADLVAVTPARAAALRKVAIGA